ncbi:hypothetical protein C1645_880259 [Glomus cerebriforme]|uniref:BTB domain-containing protein n=1 Tax=Glomus cerebriforme TaxID=658196 RepID=A0A397SGQ1_9GLOM|nr:hypothetical protein C1645_880259 [Glomus cerebriforme]
MEIISNLKQLFNDHYTYDVVLRIDGKFYFAHSVMLKYQSGYFLEYFDDCKNDDNTKKNGNYYIDCSCLINRREVIKNWYDIIDKDKKEQFHNIEFYYDYEIFGKFLSYFYGWPVYVRTNEQLFTIAYLAKKFKVTGLTKMMDGLLKYLPTTWQQNDIENWKITLNICKWLELDQSQLEITNYLRKNKVELNNINNNELTITFGRKKRKRDEENSKNENSDR